MTYRLIHQLQQKAIPVKQACQVLAVSRAGYYQHRKRGQSEADTTATARLKAAFAASNRSYGSRRLCRALRAQGTVIGRYRIRRLMREAALHPVWRRKFIHTTDSKHALPVADNVLDRQFDVTAPNRAWVSDITYIRTGQGWLYLAAVMDLFSRKVVGWAMAPTMPTDLVASALCMAVQQRNPPAGLLLHSDRGSQYASLESAGVCGNVRVLRLYFPPRQFSVSVTVDADGHFEIAQGNVPLTDDGGRVSNQREVAVAGLVRMGGKRAENEHGKQQVQRMAFSRHFLSSSLAIRACTARSSSPFSLTQATTSCARPIVSAATAASSRMRTSAGSFCCFQFC